MTGAPSPTLSCCVDVLVVEDEDRLRSFILRALPEMGLTGVGAASVDDARDLLRTHDIRVLLLDIRIGSASGLDLLDELRSAGETRPAVMMTAYADVPSVQRALRSDAADFLTKPFTLAQLEQALSRACCAASSRTPAAPSDHGDAPVSVEMAKRRALRAALDRADGNKLQAARELGVSRRTLYNWLARYDQ